MTRVALYARVSTSDRDQDPETQLIALRDFVNANGIEVHREYVDRAPANDLVHRTAWRDLLDDAAKKRFKTAWRSSWTVRSGPSSTCTTRCQPGRWQA